MAPRERTKYASGICSVGAMTATEVGRKEIYSALRIHTHTAAKAIFTSAYSAEPTADDVRLSREHASREILI